MPTRWPAGPAAGDLGRVSRGLVRRYQRRVYALAYQHLRDTDEAQDLAQEGLRPPVPEPAPLRPGAAVSQPWFWRLAVKRGRPATGAAARRAAAELHDRGGRGTEAGREGGGCRSRAGPLGDLSEDLRPAGPAALLPGTCPLDEDRGGDGPVPEAP